MKSILDIRVQKLFLITIILKVGSSFLGWYFQYQWSLGFVVPLSIMIIYIIIGFHRHDKEVTDEKFADSCYYLGFIFTITSIIFSLFDLPNIGTKIQDIAVRFGAAMVSTVIGLGVRVYLVNFKRDVADAIQDAENAVIDASQKFQEQLLIVFERLCDFEFKINNAAKATVDNVNTQVEILSKNHADKLSEFFIDLTDRNQDAFTNALEEVKTASLRLSDSVDGYSEGMRSNLKSVENKVTAFTEGITNRLKTTTFPDEYFAKHLEEPLAHLTDSAKVVSTNIKLVAFEVGESSAVLSGALKTLRAKAKSTGGSLDKVINLTGQQQAVLDTAHGQLTVLNLIANNLSKFDSAMSKTLEAVESSAAVTSNLATRVEAVVAESSQARQSLETSLTAIVSKLDAYASATDSVAKNIDTNSSATQLVAGKFDLLLQAEERVIVTLSNLGGNISKVIAKEDNTTQQLKMMEHNLVSLNSEIRGQNSEIQQIIENSKDVKNIVERLNPYNGFLNSTSFATSLQTQIGYNTTYSPQDVTSTNYPSIPSTSSLKVRQSISNLPLPQLLNSGIASSKVTIDNGLVQSHKVLDA